MPEAVQTYSFDTSLSPWFGDGFGFGFRATDGSPTAGCMYGTANAATAGGSKTNSAHLEPLSWEGLGVPSGKRVVKVRARLMWRRRVDDPETVVRTRFVLTVGTIAPHPIYGYPVQTEYGLLQHDEWTRGEATSWAQVTGGDVCIPEARSASTQSIALNLRLETFVTGGAPFSIGNEFGFDSIEITTTYEDVWSECGAGGCAFEISPTTATVEVNQQASFLTSGPATFAVDEPGGGSVTAGGTYTAPGTAGTYHVTATSIEDPDCTARATITVTDPAPLVPMSISPSEVTIPVNSTQEFQTNQPANWGVEGNEPEVNGIGSPDGPNGTIAPHDPVDPEAPAVSRYAEYTAPGTPGTYTVQAQDASDHPDAGTNIAEATVHVVPQEVEIAAESAGVFATTLFNSNRERKRIPPGMIRTLDWEDLRYGGWGSFTATLNSTFEEAQQTFDFGDVLEVRWNGALRYRGYVYGVDRTVQEPEQVQVKGYAVSFKVLKGQLQQGFYYPEAVDISRAFADIAAKAVTPLWDVVVDAQEVGATVRAVESTYRSAVETIDEMCRQQGENRALWGGDADALEIDRIYVKPFSQVIDHVIPVPGRNVTGGMSQHDASGVVNRLLIQGGNPQHPNLVYNASFDRAPRYVGDAVLNLVPNGSFEQDSDWTGTGERLATGSVLGNPFAGSWVIQTDIDGQYRTVELDPGAALVTGQTNYRFTFWAKAMSVGTVAVGRFSLTWLDSSGTDILTEDMEIGPALPLTLTTAWKQFRMSQRAPGNATAFRLRFEAVSGAISGHGILWDLFECYPVGAVVGGMVQDGWELAMSGGLSSVNGVDWFYPDAMDGGYSIWLDVVSNDSDSFDVRLQPVGARPFEVTGGIPYRAMAHVKSPPGVTANPKLILEVEEFDSEGNQTTSNNITIAAGAGWANWTQYNGVVTLDETTTHALVRLRIRGTGSLLVDGISFRDAGAGTEFIRDGQYVTQIDVTDSELVGLSPAAADSIETYGVRDGQEHIDSIGSRADALAYASAYFNAHAIAWAQPQVEVIDDDRWFRPGQNVRLIGDDGPALMQGEEYLPIVAVKWKWDGHLRASLELKKEPPDLAALFLKRLKRLAGGGSSRTSSSAGLSSGSGTSYTHPVSPVTPGTYSNPTLTVDAFGHVTAAASGTGSEATGRWEPLTDGDPDDTQLVFDGAGDVVMVWVEE